MTFKPLGGAAILRTLANDAALKWAQRDLETVRKVLDMVPRRRAVVQAGGNLGVFAGFLANKFDHVYTFEPDPDLFHALVANVPARNVIKLQAALGLERRPVAMKCSRRDDSGRPVHSGLTHVDGPGHLPTMRIDDLGLSACDLIYLDVEGWEFFALQGAYKTIRSCKPVIAVEVNRNITHAGHTAEQLRKLICSHGYEPAFTMHSDEIFRPVAA